MNKRTLALAAALAALSLSAQAQKPVSQAAVVELKSTIQAIDHANRLVTLKDQDGDIETIYAGPEVKRFDELKVGDTVTFRYYESLVYRIRKPGDPAPAADDAKLVRSTGSRPGATLSKQESATVTIKAIDAKVPSVTVTRDDGTDASFKVEDKKNLEGVKVGDKVEITYTKALMVSVK
jgi:Cu/Ag efflux protein CusF